MVKSTDHIKVKITVLVNPMFLVKITKSNKKNGLSQMHSRYF